MSSIFASLLEAKEVPGGEYRIGVRIYAGDPYAELGGQTFRTVDGALAFTDEETFQDDSASPPVGWYEGGMVKDFGAVQFAGEPGGAFGTVGDVRLVLNDRKIMGQIDNAAMVFVYGDPEQDPAVTGDEVKLSDLLSFYILEGARVVYTVHFWSYQTGTQTSSVLKDDFFSGTIQKVTVEGKTIVLDITQDTRAEDTKLPARLITEPPNARAQGQYLPICYGEGIIEAELVDGLEYWMAAVGGYRPLLYPCTPWADDADEDYRLIVADQKGPNTGWATQAEYPYVPGGKSSAADRLIVYWEEDDVVGVILEGTSERESEVKSS